MRWSRLALMAAIAAVAAIGEALVRHPDPSVGFQAWMVVQLLGVIVAAIGVAAVASVVGLMLLRALIAPIHDRPSTFVAWSFLRAQTIDDPLPVRVARAIRRQVGAQPLQARSVGGASLAGVAVLHFGVLLGALWWLAERLNAGAPLDGLAPLIARNLGLVAGVQGLLLLSEALPWRRARMTLPVLVAVALLAGLCGLSFLPLAEPYVHGPTFVATVLIAALIVGVVVSRPRQARLRAARGWTARLWWLVLAVCVGSALLLDRLPMRVAVLTGALVVGALALYMLAQAQPKVTLPVFVSIVGVAAGTWALIVVLSVMGGFAADLRAKMLVANAHALVERPGRSKPLGSWTALSKALRAVEGVKAVSPQVRGDVIVSSTFNVNNFVALRGIDPDLPEVKRELGTTVVTGSLGLLSAPELLGRDQWQVRRPEDIDADLPPAPSAATETTSAAPTQQQDDELDAILQLAPGPATPPPPGDAPDRPPIALPSDDAALEALAEDLTDAPEAPRTIELLPTGPDADGDTNDAGGLGLPWPSGSGDVMTPVAPGILLGAELARSLQVELGDRLEVITPDADVGPTGMRPRVRTFRVAGTFETGLYDADSKVAYVTLGAASAYFNLDGAANVIELRLLKPEQPDAVLAGVSAALKNAGAPSDIEVLDWRALNRSLFSALAFERLVIFLVLALIILVASFAIVSALTMVILQKRNGIAMLQAMGASRADVRAAFVQMGGVIGGIGTIAGLLLGLTTCLLIEKLGIQLPEAYYVRELPVAIEPTEVAAVVIASLLISLVATVFPAKSAARLSPLEGLRYE